MAQYWEDWSYSTLGQMPVGWSPMFGIGGATYAVQAESDPLAPAGRRLRITASTLARRFLAMDAVSADPDRATFDVRALVRVSSYATNFSALFLGGRGSGQAASENMVGGGFARSSGNYRLHAFQYVNGSYASLRTTASQDAYTPGSLYWLRFQGNGTSITVSLAPGDSPDSPIRTWTETTTLTAAGAVGLMNQASDSVVDVLAVGIGTGDDEAPTSDPTPTPVAFSGPVPNQSAVEGSAFSLNLSTYFSGDRLPFLYTLATGTLPGSLVLDGNAGTVTGTYPAEGVISGLSFTATDADSNPATTNTFSITSIPAAQAVRGVRVQLFDRAGNPRANVTGVHVRWYDGDMPTSEALTFEANDATLDADGWLEVDVEDVTTLDIGDLGHIDLFKLGATPADDWHYGRRLSIEDIAQWIQVFDTSDIAGKAVFDVSHADAIVVVTNIETGNVDSGSVIITDVAGQEPTIYCDVRPHSALNEWRHFLFAVENAGGKRPTFRFNRATKLSPGTAPTLEFKPLWTQDFVTWTRAPSRTLVGGSTGYIEWQFTDPLPAGRVYIASHALWRQTEVEAHVDDLISSNPGIASPTDSADELGVIAISPSETDDIGRAVGQNPIHGVKIAFGGATTDGGPKRKLVLMGGTHAAGESPSWISHKAFLDYVMGSQDAPAVALRSNWDIYLYGNVSPNGVVAGAFRRNVRADINPNRDWYVAPATSALAEINAIRAAVVADTGGTADALFAWHTFGNIADSFIIAFDAEDYDPATRTPAASAAIAAGTAIFGTAPNVQRGGDGSNTQSFWGKAQLGAKLSCEAEVPMNGSTALSHYQGLGESWARTLQAVDAQGLFYAPAEAPAASLATEVALLAGVAAGEATAPSASVAQQAELLTGTVAGAAQASGAVFTAVATLQPGAASGAGAGVALGVTAEVSASLQPGIANGGAIAPAAAVGLSTALIAGTAVNGATAGGAMLVAEHSLIAGPVAGGAPATAPGFVLSMQAQLLDGIATGGELAVTPGAQLGSRAEVLGGTSVGQGLAVSALLARSSIFIPGVASGASTGVAPGAVMTSTASLIAGRMFVANARLGALSPRDVVRQRVTRGKTVVAARGYR